MTTSTLTPAGEATPGPSSRPASQVGILGPWRVLGDGVTIAQDRKTHRTHVARALEIYGDRAEREANAKLLAAAWSMRDALQAMVEICERSFAPSHAALAMGSKNWVEGRQLRAAVDAALAALAHGAVPAGGTNPQSGDEE